jgi:hypothetical protein
LKRTHLLAWQHLLVLLVELAEIHQLLAFELVDLDAAGALAELVADVSSYPLMHRAVNGKPTSQKWLSVSSFAALLLFLVPPVVALVFLLLGASSTKPPSAS